MERSKKYKKQEARFKGHCLLSKKDRMKPILIIIKEKSIEDLNGDIMLKEAVNMPIVNSMLHIF